MRRATKKLLLLATLVMSVNGCFCADLFGPPGGSGGGSGGSGGGAGPTETRFPQCLTAYGDAMTADSLLAAQLPPVGADGVQEVPLSPEGCYYLQRTVRSGQVTHYRVARAFGYLMPARDPLTNALVEAEYEHVLADWTFTTSGSRGLFDNDEDGYQETELVESFGAGLLVRSVLTETDGPTQQVVFRATTTPASGGNIRFVREELVSGALTTTADATVPGRQRQTANCYAAHADAPLAGGCSAAHVAETRAKMREAVARGLECLNRHEGPLRDRHILTVMGQGMTDRFPIRCFDGNESAGSAHLDERDSNGLVPISVNVGMLGGCEASNFAVSTLFHELLHATRGPHLDDELFFNKLPKGAIDKLGYVYSDSLRACEELCFGTIKTRCSCAACLQVKACDGKCSSYGTCTVPSADGGYSMSQAVGALCKTDPPSWHATFAACQGACGSPSSCKSMSLSCDPNCK